ncbi:hypothetical protein [Kineococcus sp. SYSU DK005]|uniref:hypothetical protein n=1 Tax=Kineococcus sp. SYSU DK005 TaxID=3383126 RepID=UPI003D7DB96C
MTATLLACAPLACAPLAGGAGLVVPVLSAWWRHRAGPRPWRRLARALGLG